jgi:hypothetical protein
MRTLKNFWTIILHDDRTERVLKLLTYFYSAIRVDNRIGICHITLYIGLFQVSSLNNFENPILINRSLIMKMAKISGPATYHKCIKDLAKFGYIEYLPSFNPGIGSHVRLLEGCGG